MAWKSEVENRQDDISDVLWSLSITADELDWETPRPYMVTANLREAIRYLDKAMASLEEAKGAQR